MRFQIQKLIDSLYAFNYDERDVEKLVTAVEDHRAATSSDLESAAHLLIAHIVSTSSLSMKAEDVIERYNSGLSPSFYNLIDGLGLPTDDDVMEE